MKKKFIYLLLTAPLVLVACQNSDQITSQDTSSNNSTSDVITEVNPSNATSFFKDSLEKLKIGYHFDSKIKQTTYQTSNPDVKDTTISVVETYVVEDKFSFKLYNPTPNLDKSDLGAFETYYKGDDGLTYSARINVNNEIAKRKVLHPTGNGVFNFVNEGFGNMFKDLAFQDFIQLSSFDYSLNLSKVKKPNLKETIAASLYGGPGLKAKTFAIKLTKDAKILVTSALETFVGKTITYEYVIESTLNPITTISFPDRNNIYPEVNDPLFNEKINSLKNYNFTLTQKDISLSGEVLKESKLLINPDKFYSTTFDTLGRPMNVGMYKDNEKYYGVVRQEDGSYIQGDEVTKEIYSYYLPTLKISRSVFDKQADGTYILKPQIDSDSSPFSRYETDADELNKTKIQFKENTIEVTNSFGKYTTSIIYSNIGSTDVGYTKDSVIKTELNLTSWDEVFSENQIEKMKTFMGGEISHIPFPTMLKDATSFSLGINVSSGIMQIVYTSAAIPSKPSDIKEYNALLEANNWEKQQGSNDEAGHYKKVINEQEYQVTTESDGLNFYLTFFKVK